MQAHGLAPMGRHVAIMIVISTCSCRGLDCPPASHLLLLVPTLGLCQPVGLILGQAWWLASRYPALSDLSSSLGPDPGSLFSASWNTVTSAIRPPGAELIQSLDSILQDPGNWEPVCSGGHLTLGLTLGNREERGGRFFLLSSFPHLHFSRKLMAHEKDPHPQSGCFLLLKTRNRNSAYAPRKLWHSKRPRGGAEPMRFAFGHKMAVEAPSITWKCAEDKQGWDIINSGRENVPRGKHPLPFTHSSSCNP